MAAVVVMYSYTPNKHKIINHDNYCPEVVPQWPVRCQICMGKQDMLWKVQCTRNRTKLMEGRQKSNVSLSLTHQCMDKKMNESRPISSIRWVASQIAAYREMSYLGKDLWCLISSTFNRLSTNFKAIRNDWFVFSPNLQYTSASKTGCHICKKRDLYLWEKAGFTEERHKSNVSLPLKHHALGKKISEAIRKAMLGPYQAVGGQQAN